MACARRWRAPPAATASRWPTAKKSLILSTRFISARRSSRRAGRLGAGLARRLGTRRKRPKKPKPRRAAARAVKKEKIQSGLAKGAVRAAQEGLPVYSISADVEGSTGMSFFQKSFPDRFVEVGVAEANMISTGAGFAKAGFIPIVDTFGQFGVTKGNLPLTMSALSQAPVIAVFSHVGFQDAADGASHEATTYFAADLRHSAHRRHRLFLRGRGGGADVPGHQTPRPRPASEGRDGESVIFFVGRENYPVHWVDNRQL